MFIIIFNAIIMFLITFLFNKG